MSNISNSISPSNSVVVGSNNTACNTDYFTDQQTIDLFSQRTDDELSLLHINIRSIVKNYSNLTNYIMNFTVKPDIIALSETKITEKVNSDALVDIDGYVFVHKKSATHFGGVGFYISQKIDYKLREDLDMTDKNCDCQTLFIETTAKNKAKQVIGVLYRHPKPDFQSFSDEYENLLTKLANERKKVLHFGGL